MNNAVYNFPLPENEPILDYLKGSKERVLLENELKRQSQTILEIPLIIGGKEILTGNFGEIRMPHDHNKVIARYHKAGRSEVELAIKEALEARRTWSDLAWT
jgi:1-pyrroline-5-carboxylate dehydrogenase